MYEFIVKEFSLFSISVNLLLRSPSTSVTMIEKTFVNGKEEK